MTPTPDQVEQLARWLDATYRETRPTPVRWEGREHETREAYRHVARALLERPPPPLLDALGGCVPDAVAGRAAP